MLDGEHGDPVAGAAQLDALLDGEALFATDRLRALGVRAVAADRAGDSDAARRRDDALTGPLVGGSGADDPHATRIT